MTELKGKCLCGAITVEAKPEAEDIHACHCSICRSWSAGPFLAIGCGRAVTLGGDENLGVYRSSEWAERVFCKNCGTSIAWRLHDGSAYFVSSQLFNEAHSYPLNSEIFIDEKPDNYSFEQTTQTLTGAEVFAMSAPPESQ